MQNICVRLTFFAVMYILSKQNLPFTVVNVKIINRLYRDYWSLKNLPLIFIFSWSEFKLTTRIHVNLHMLAVIAKLRKGGNQAAQIYTNDKQICIYICNIPRSALELCKMCKILKKIDPCSSILPSLILHYDPHLQVFMTSRDKQNK